MSELKAVKTISGELLIYFYWLQRSDITKLSDSILSFQLRHLPEELAGNGPVITRREDTILSIDKLSQYNDGDLFQALRYLHDYGLVEFNESPSNMDVSLLNIRVTASGIDIVEGIERGNDAVQNFNITFNFNLNNDITIENLVKAELGSIFKASVL